MARFFAVNGVLGLAKSDTEIAFIPAGATTVADFDETTNATLIAEFDSGYSRFAVVSGQLRRDGVAVVFNADSSAKQEIDDVISQAAAAISANQAYINLASPTNAQNAAQIKALSIQMNRVIRRLVRLGKLQGK